MIYETVQDDLKSQDPSDLAKSIWNFFLFQYDCAKREEINARSEYDSFLSANQRAEEEYRREADPGFGIFEPPYSQHALENQKEEMVRASKNLADAKALMNFIRDRFVDKFVGS